jgi:hypothetical protein
MTKSRFYEAGDRWYLCLKTVVKTEKSFLFKKIAADSSTRTSGRTHQSISRGAEHISATISFSPK